MDQVLERENMLEALKRVSRNKKSAPGVDGMTVDQLRGALIEQWPTIKLQLQKGSYQPSPVRIVYIPKENGSLRQLGIPTLIDRLIQQALLIVMNRIFDPTFSDHSYGFRPARSAHEALLAAQSYVEEGRIWTVDIDLAKFFDEVNHDMLMSRVKRKIKDKRVLRLIRSYLRAPRSTDQGLQIPKKGTPQGGPLSPLLANILLDEVDKELEKRGHAFIRYADDSRIFVFSQRAGERVMKALAKIYAKLKLPINDEKSAVALFDQRPLLGCIMTLGKKKKVWINPSKKSVKKFKEKMKRLTRRSAGRSVDHIIEALTRYARGWFNYFQVSEKPRIFKTLMGWTRRRLRAIILKHWKNSTNIARNLRKLGASDQTIGAVTRFTGRWWKISTGPIHKVLTLKFFQRIGLPQFL
ncbi:MAG: group II intron reverse transcriptase/maturase [Methylococcales bacterium]|nr:group II intron reverse transcriptase/maturase [Methylococcales bacterium]